MRGHFEAKKHAYRQTQDGVVVSFVMHPNEITPEFAAAPLGTIFVVGYATPDENDSAVKTAGMDNSPALAHETTEAVVTGRQAPHPLVQLGWQLCERADYQKWICGVGQTSERYAYSRAEAEELTRLHCGVESRAEFRTNPEAAAKFEALVARFKLDTGQMAERRG